MRSAVKAYAVSDWQAGRAAIAWKEYEKADQ
jgi:hypothetical protein